MNLHRLMIIHFILSCPNVLTCDNRYFKICPQNGSASLGSSFIFNCVTIMKIKKCVWIKPNSLNVYPTSGVKKIFNIIKPVVLYDNIKNRKRRLWMVDL